MTRRRARTLESFAAAAGTALLLAACGGSGTEAKPTPATVTVTATTTATVTATPSTAPAPDTSDASGSAEASAKPSASHTLAHWTYEGEDGPENWADLDPAYSACGEGTKQSPIDIETVKVTNAAEPKLAYRSGKVTIVNNGHTIQADASPGSTMTVDGVTYPLLQMHFHAPSENTIGGEHEPIELHFVHKTDDGKIAVLGVMVQEKDGSPNPAYAPLVQAMGTPEGKSTNATLDWNALIPADLTTYRFDGSLTTPPCTEGVKWFVASEPVQLGTPQVAAFVDAYSGNNRPVQPLNGRTVTYG